jgi:hypothetical protein
MNKVLIGIIIVMTTITYYLYTQNKVLSANNIALKSAVATQEEAIASLQNDFALQTSSLLDLQSRNQEIQQEMTRYLDIFKRHNLTKLAAAKPGLIEPRVNKGTKDALKKTVVTLTVLMMVCSCSLLPTKQIEVTAKPMERTIVQPIMPREIDLKDPYWYVVSDKNLEEFLARVEKDQGQVVFLAMSVPDYELMAYNMQELKRYINELKEVVVYYKTVTTKEQ